jgi:phosphoribosyl 1,2-cyclic phosphodiesterase
MPYTVPHDALEPLQLRCTDGAKTLGVLTDAGAATPHLLAHLQDCQALLLECNHDRELLAASRYPASLKTRIGGRLGHLANDTAAQILAGCLHAGLRCVVAAHLSAQNNRPELAQAALAAVSGCPAGEIVVADQALGTEWLDVA